MTGVEEKIEFVRHLENVVVTSLPDTAQFECELSRPNVKVQWTKSGKPLLPDHKFDIAMDGAVHRLGIRDVTGQDDVTEYSATIRGLASKASLDIQGDDDDDDVLLALTLCGHIYRNHRVRRN